MKFLTPAWLGVYVGVLAIAVTLALYINGQPVKRLRIEVLSNSPLVSIDTAMAKELQIMYKGLAVQSLSLILLRIANTGTEPIKETDYSDPIRITISETASVGEATVQETQPDSIQLAPTVAPRNQVALAKALLNPGDQAVIRILALNNDSTLKITARIVGVSTLDIQSVLDRKDTKGLNQNAVLSGALILVLLILSVAFLWQSTSVIQWRRRHFGLDPARYFYTLAQGGMLTLSSSTNEKASMALTQVVRNLDKALTWDITYMQRVEADPLFSKLLSYEKFKDVVAKHKAGATDPLANPDKH